MAVTLPRGETRPMVFVSEVNTMPSEAKVSPNGYPMCAAEPTPGSQAELPLPANVVTAPDGEILRIILLCVSPTYMLRSGPIVIPHGCENVAEVPTPLANTMLPEPATVETRPVGETRLMRWFCVSATYKSPAALNTRSDGWKKLAIAAGPSAQV